MDTRTVDRRNLRDLCQDCYAIVRPDRYFVETFRSGTCAACGQDAFVGRVSVAESRRAADAVDAAAVRDGIASGDTAARDAAALRYQTRNALPARGDAGTRPLVTPEDGAVQARWDRK